MSNRHNAKHNTTRSKHTSDKRPKHAQKQLDKYHDMTGGQNEHQQLNSNTDRGQTLGSGPWGQGHAMGPGSNVEPWQGNNDGNQG
jgi:hypothetical protein